MDHDDNYGDDEEEASVEEGTEDEKAMREGQREPSATLERSNQLFSGDMPQQQPTRTAAKSKNIQDEVHVMEWTAKQTTIQTFSRTMFEEESEFSRFQAASSSGSARASGPIDTPRNVRKLCRLVRSCIRRHHNSSALFYADKLVGLFFSAANHCVVGLTCVGLFVLAEKNSSRCRLVTIETRSCLRTPAT